MQLTRVAISTWVCACALTGCAFQAAPPDSTGRMLDEQLNESAHRIDALLVDISRAGGISAVVPKAGVVLVSGDFITVRWYGDAPEVLQKIAEAKGLKFSVLGKPFPVPVSIDATNTDFVTVLSNIGTQLGARADVVLKNGALELKYRAL
jgi:hypothetical protein